MFRDVILDEMRGYDLRAIGNTVIVPLVSVARYFEISRFQALNLPLIGGKSRLLRY